MLTTKSAINRQMFGSAPPDDWKGCSELQMLEGIKDIRDIYNLSY